MISSTLPLSRSRAVLRLTVGLGLSLVSVPAAMAVTTAIATASLSFNVSSPHGPLGFSSASLNGTADLNAGPPATSRSYFDTSGGPALTASEAIGNNSFTLSSSVSGRTFTASSGVSLSVPPFVSSEGRSSSFNFVNIDTLHIVPVDDMFDLKFSSVRALLNLSLGTDGDGVSAFGGASWFVGLRYSFPGDTEGGSTTQSVSKEIGTDDSLANSNGYYSSFTFNSIPASATNVQLYWETTADARAVDAARAPLAIPDSGTTLAFFGTGLGALGWMRRKLRGSRV
jgi:hypothetical protein